MSTRAKTTVFFTTVVRSAPVERGGELIRLDWDEKKVVCKTPMVPTNPGSPDPNDRGGRRGGRGIALQDKGIVAATSDSLRLYDFDLRLVKTISHPLMAGVHEIISDGNGRIWVAATAIDAVLLFDPDSGELLNQVWPRDMPGLQHELGLAPLAIDRAADNRHRVMDETDDGHLHLNAVGLWNDEVHALFNRQGVIANLENGTIVVRGAALRGSHNLWIDGDGVATVNRTLGPAVARFDLEARKPLEAIDLTQFGWVRRLRRRSVFQQRVRRLVNPQACQSWARPLFARGLDMVGNRLFIGISPASILCVDRPTGRLIDVFRYSQDVRCCVHGLMVAQC